MEKKIKAAFIATCYKDHGNTMIKVCGYSLFIFEKKNHTLSFVYQNNNNDIILWSKDVLEIKENMSVDDIIDLIAYRENYDFHKVDSNNFKSQSFMNTSDLMHYSEFLKTKEN